MCIYICIYIYMIKLYNYVHEKKTIEKTPAFFKSFPFQATVITVTSC